MSKIGQQCQKLDSSVSNQTAVSKIGRQCLKPGCSVLNWELASSVLFADFLILWEGYYWLVFTKWFFSLWYWLLSSDHNISDMIHCLYIWDLILTKLLIPCNCQTFKGAISCALSFKCALNCSRFSFRSG